MAAGLPSFQCPKSKEMFSKNVATYYADAKKYAVKMKTAEVEKEFFTYSKKGQLITFITPDSTPANSKFRKLPISCWQSLNEIIKGAALKKIPDHLKDWKTCIEYNFKVLPDVATKILNCWESYSK